MSETTPPADSGVMPPADKVKQFPQTPGVYLMKDRQGRVLYVGKAKNLRHRASHYFTAAAAEDPRTADLVKLIADIDYLEADSEVDALLMEARLVKDLQPRFNVELKDDKTFPYLQIRIREEFPRVEFTRSPRRHGVKLYGPFTSARGLRTAIQVLQRILQFRTCSLDIRSDDPRWRWFRPCLLHSIRQCTAPCNLRVSRDEYRQQIRSLRMVLEGKKNRLIAEMEKEMAEASAALQFEKAARLRDEIAALRNLGLRGDVEKDVQPEVFPLEPRKGILGLRKVLGLSRTPRVIEGIDIAHLGGHETVAALVAFIDGLPFKPGYRRYRIRTVAGIDDFASIREVVARRFRPRPATRPTLGLEEQIFPDVLLIDGGKGQLNAALEVFRLLGVDPPCLISLAKREEEIYRPGQAEPIRLSRRSAALRLLQYVRDEAHRFAQHYHHLLRRKKFTDPPAD
ncbi:MAG: excinuclease ABC subunit UvrC [Gemmataceae bacterium]|nr:excinuclease ABC subunit UvrC [Gemmataceae bacterium]MDW8266536.1 excinuclease ABC subunit UvrC [Gemmataceae bacterium]